MIKFFRNIRKTLLSEGKTSKYLKYAIGEIILVVIGILIALQVNNWNELRKHRANEKLYLESLYKDILEMDKHYEWRFEKSNQLLKTSRDGFQYLNNCGTFSNKMALDSTLLTHQALPDFFIIDGTYNEMLTGSILTSLSNTELKNNIIQLFTEINSLNEYITYFRTDLGRASSIIWKYVGFEYNTSNLLKVNYDLKDICLINEFKNALVEVIDSREDYTSSILELKMMIDLLKEQLHEEINNYSFN